jgi:hypothetical protein
VNRLGLTRGDYLSTLRIFGNACLQPSLSRTRAARENCCTNAGPFTCRQLKSKPFSTPLFLQATYFPWDRSFNTFAKSGPRIALNLSGQPLIPGAAYSVSLLQRKTGGSEY